MNQFILVLLAFNLLYPHATYYSFKPTIRRQSGFEKLTVDLAQCKPVTRSLAWGLGSESVEVKGRRRNRCILQHTSEIEGGYSTKQCRIPISLGELTISAGYSHELDYSLKVSKYCKVIKAGNIFFDSIPKRSPRPIKRAGNVPLIETKI